MVLTRTGYAAGWAGFSVALLAGLAAVFITTGPQVVSKISHNSTSTNYPGTKILQVFAKHAFDWSSSTTPAPLSVAAVLVKQILADKGALPHGLESAIRFGVEDGESQERVLDVHVAPVRNFISSRVLQEVENLCSGGGCDPDEADPEFGITPLHLAEFWGSSELSEFLLSMGADPEAFDSVGRQPRNMTFKTFSANSKRAADARHGPGAHPDERCEIPEVTIPLFPRLSADEIEAEENKVATVAWQESVQTALSEVRRLVSEGEPVMVRNMLPWLKSSSLGEGAHGETEPLEYPSPAAFVEAWGHRPVDVGKVPYAKNFELLNERKTLREYVAAPSDATAAADRNMEAPPPNYVFQVDTEACGEGLNLMARIVEAALPSSGDRPIICPPPRGFRGLESVHYYLGGRSSGAPFHIHSDAINLAVTGKKRWWVVTPRHAVWSRRHVREYAEERKGGPRGGSGVGGEEAPMECVQHGGDLVYVPGEWGHGVINLDDDTFG